MQCWWDQLTWSTEEWSSIVSLLTAYWICMYTCGKELIQRFPSLILLQFSVDLNSTKWSQTAVILNKGIHQLPCIFTRLRPEGDETYHPHSGWVPVGWHALLQVFLELDYSLWMSLKESGLSSSPDTSCFTNNCWTDFPDVTENDNMIQISSEICDSREIIIKKNAFTH